jgi:hypothetical protein
MGSQPFITQQATIKYAFSCPVSPEGIQYTNKCNRFSSFDGKITK